MAEQFPELEQLTLSAKPLGRPEGQSAQRNACFGTQPPSDVRAAIGDSIETCGSDSTTRSEGAWVVTNWVRAPGGGTFPSARESWSVPGVQTSKIDTLED